MSFIKLTRAYDGELVLVNPSQIKAIYDWGDKKTTIVDYGDPDNGFIRVIESVGTIYKMCETNGEFGGQK